MNKPKAYLMIGIPGSGKSTWVKDNLPNVAVISRDIIRHELGFTKSVDHKAVLSKEQEDLVTKVQNDNIKHNLSIGQDIVIDDMNTGKYRKGMIDNLRSCGADVIAVHMNTPLETCIKRREEQISPEIMKNIHSRVVKFSPEEVDDVIEVPDNTNN